MENLPIVHVVNGRQKKLLQGHPWVYGNEIERVEGEIEDGGLVTVVDFRGRYMGTGFYNSKSLNRAPDPPPGNHRRTDPPREGGARLPPLCDEQAGHGFLPPDL
ncbi:MAG: hypothetical protein ACLVJB_01635 [Christensenellales bacterium]